MTWQIRDIDVQIASVVIFVRKKIDVHIPDDMKTDEFDIDHYVCELGLRVWLSTLSILASTNEQ